MGNRVSIAFALGDEKPHDESVTLFSHWDGMSLIKSGISYMDELLQNNESEMYPLDRFEPQTVMLNFILWLKQNEKIDYPCKSNYYLGHDRTDGDNSNNGHFVFAVNKTKRTYSVYVVDENEGYIREGLERLREII